MPAHAIKTERSLTHEKKCVIVNKTFYKNNNTLKAFEMIWAQSLSRESCTKRKEEKKLCEWSIFIVCDLYSKWNEKKTKTKNAYTRHTHKYCLRILKQCLLCHIVSTWVGFFFFSFIRSFHSPSHNHFLHTFPTLSSILHSVICLSQPVDITRNTNYTD